MTDAPQIARLDLRDLTITTAIAYEVDRALDDQVEGASVELVIGTAPALVPDLQAWAQARGHELEIAETDAAIQRLRIRKGQLSASSRRVAIIVTSGGLEELLSPLGFALAAALEGAEVSVYIQGPAVRVLRPGYSPTLPWPMRPFSRFARQGLAKAGHPGAIDKLRQLQTLGARLYACGPSLAHFGVDPDDLALDGVTICEYLTFMAVMQDADVQLYP